MAKETPNFFQRWKDALKQARSRLTGLDENYWKSIQSFGSHDALLKDLEKRKTEATDRDKRSLYSKVNSYVLPCHIRYFNSTSRRSGAS
jgi:hypothetical protein